MAETSIHSIIPKHPQTTDDIKSNIQKFFISCNIPKIKETNNEKNFNWLDIIHGYEEKKSKFLRSMVKHEVLADREIILKEWENI